LLPAARLLQSALKFAATHLFAKPARAVAEARAVRNAPGTVIANQQSMKWFGHGNSFSWGTSADAEIALLPRVLSQSGRLQLVENDHDGWRTMVFRSLPASPGMRLFSPTP
jgi:hypothetical protein